MRVRSTVAACASPTLILRVFLLAVFFAAAHSQTLLWNFNTSYIISAGAAVSSNKLLVGGWDCKLYALDPSNSGKLLWSYTLPTYQPLKKLSLQRCAIRSAPVVDSNSVSNVYLHSSDGYLYAFNASSPTTPSLRWSFPYGNISAIAPPTSPVLSSDGAVVYSTSIGRYMYAVNSSTGQQVWNISVANASVSTTPVISTGDGEPILFFGTTQGYLFAAHAANGSQAWSFYVGTASKISAGPSLGANGTHEVFVFFGCSDKNVYALHASSGSLRWVYNTTAPVTSSPTYDPTNSDGPALCVFPPQCFVRRAAFSFAVMSNLSQPVQVRRQQQRPASCHLYRSLLSRQVDVAVPAPEQQKLGLQGGGFRQFTVRSPYAAHGLLCRIILCHYSQVHRLLRQQRLCHLHFRGQKGPSEVDIPHRRQCASVTAVVPQRRQAVCGQL
jgi:outer membrane protein assembly factor BamB